MASWLTLFLINWLINIVVVELFAIRKLKPIIKVDEARDSQFPAFRRNDTKWFNRPWLYLTCPFMILRIFVAFFSLFICAIVCNIAVIGLKKDDTIKGVRYMIIRTIQFVVALIVNGATGCFWYVIKYPKVCYKKYLGDDWEPDWNWRHECGCVITNHQTLFDTFTHSL